VSLQAASFFASETAQWLKQTNDDLTTVSTNFEGHCSRVQCDESMPGDISKLKALEANIKSIQNTFSAKQLKLCPSTGCLNLEILWLIKGTGCLCDADGIQSLLINIDDGALFSLTPFLAHLEFHRIASKSTKSVPLAVCFAQLLKNCSHEVMKCTYGKL
jgi:hypothetical protein